MMLVSQVLTLALGVYTHSVLARYSHLSADFRPANFFDNFDFFTGADPTHGKVSYKSRGDAQASGLISSGADNVYIGVDHWLFTGSGGRGSVRIESKQRFTRGLFILDLAHMPYGCGTWPAWWTLGDNWPYNGEIDIIEGVHEQSNNLMALHTQPGCTTNSNAQTGWPQSRNCDVWAPGQPSNQGCSTSDSRANSYGRGFNNNGGGVFAMEWNRQAIKVWFFPRGQIPDNALRGNPAPENWGTPAATFQGNCNIDGMFREHRIIFDVTFCGDWAGSVWGNSGCQNRAATCNDFVANNPGAFADAYWLINSMKVWGW